MNCDRVFVVLTRGPFPTGDPSDEAVEAHLARCRDCRRLAEALRPAARVKGGPRLPDAELFGPMVEEIIGFEERRRLPGYWGEASSEAADEILARFSDSAEAAPKQEPIAATCPPPAARRPRVSFRQARLIGVAVVIGVTLGVALRFWGAGGPPLWGGAGHLWGAAGHLWGGAGHRVLSAHSQPGPSDDTPHLLATNRQLLATERLPEACKAAPRPPVERTPAERKPADGQVTHLLASFPQPVQHQACCTQCHHAGGDKKIPAAAASAVRNNCKFCHGDMPRAAADTW